MIICICPNKEDEVYQDALASLNAYPDIFRSAHLAFDTEIPQLKTNEELFVIAHGGFDVDGTPIIGENGETGLRVDSFTLWLNIQGLFPDGFHGDVFVSTCHSAETGPRAVYSFIEMLAVYVKGKHGPHCNVFGHDGLVEGLIPLPGSTAWRPADVG